MHFTSSPDELALLAALTKKDCALDVDDAPDDAMMADVDADAAMAALDDADGDDAESMSVEDDDAENFDLDPDEDEDEDDEEDITDERGAILHGDDGTLLPPVTERSMSATATPIVSLRSANLFGAGQKPTVDRDAGAIRNVSIMQAGPADGHGFNIDKTMLNQIAGQMAGGKPMRYTHPERPVGDGTRVPVDSLGTHVGRITNVKMDPDGNQVRGDIEFGKHASNVPMLGDVKSYLMDLAESDPSAFGLSVAFRPADYERDARSGVPLGRSAGVAACDLTGDPAANRQGLC
jgi:hypothetical protein